MGISRPTLVRFLSLIAVLAFLGSESQSFGAGPNVEPNVWTSIGPDGGGVNVLAIDPKNPRTIYSGTSGGIFKSTDGGESWKVLNLPGSPAVLAVAIDPMNPGMVYAGTTIGVFKTTDGGGTWSPPKMTFPVVTIAIAVTSPDTLFAVGVFQGIRALMKSTDGGTLWSAAMEPPITTFAVAIDPQTPGTVYAGTGSGLLKSIHGGANWTLIGSFQAFNVAIDPQDPNTIFAINRGGVFKSTDAGMNWSAASSGLPFNSASCLSIDPQNRGTVYAGTSSGVFKTTNGGSNWSPTNSGVTGTFIRSLAIDPQSPATVYAVIQTDPLDHVNASVFKSTNGGTSWVQSHSGLTASFVSAMAVDPQFPDILYGVVDDNFVESTNGGTTWFSVGLPTRVLSLAIYLQDPRILYAATARGVFKSSDRGVSWTATSYSSLVYSVAIDPQDSNTVYAGTSYSGVLKSTDGGATWNVFDSGLGLGDIFILTVDPQRSSTVYALVNGEYDQPPLYRGINKSTDGGIHWTAVNDGLPTEPYDWVFVSAFAIDPKNSATLYAGTAIGVFKSADGGASWSAVHDGLADGIGTIAVDPHKPNTIYAGTWRSGVFRSANAGSTWDAVNLGLTTLSVSSLVIDPKDSNRLYAGTSGGGAFAITFVPELVVTELQIDRTSVLAGGSFSVNISGPNFTPQTFFDVRFTSPESNVPNTVLNWQRGVAASHAVPVSTTSGAWTINGVRAHEIEADHTGSFVPVSGTITVSP